MGLSGFRALLPESISVGKLIGLKSEIPCVIVQLTFTGKHVRHILKHNDIS